MGTGLLCSLLEGGRQEQLGPHPASPECKALTCCSSLGLRQALESHGGLWACT